MDVTSTTPLRNDTPAPPAFAPPDGESAETRGPALASDFETFLRMLTVQMQNQDPLEPDSASDFAVQLATFSTVEQQVRTNDLLEGLDARMTAMGLGQLSAWIGMDGQAPAPAIFDGAPVPFSFTTEPTADRATLVVSNALGAEVQRLPIDPAGGTGTWDGSDTSGAPLPPGAYDLVVEAYAGEDFLGQQPAHVYAPITEVRQGDEGATIVFASGASVPASDVTGLRSQP